MRILLYLFFSICFTAAATAQPLQPLDIARKLFGQDSVPGIEQFVTGEYQGEPNGRNLQPGAILHFQLLQQSSATAVVGMTILDSSGRGLDTYLHFKKDSLWKMCAFRALAMTGLIEKLKEDLEKMTAAEISSMIEKGKKEKRKDFQLIRSKEDYDFQLGNARLTIAQDDSIIKHFKNNRAAFDSLKEAALSAIKLRKSGDNSRTPMLEEMKAVYQRLFIAGIYYGEYELGAGNLSFIIGGILDNTVGYLYISDSKNIPAMSPGNLIMLKEIGNGWYIYKTT